ncbi:MAG: hypothetical protein R3C12_07010 [Planctomycetaceae bacterium]
MCPSIIRSRIARFRALRWVSRQLIKAKPSLHKQTYLKPLHQTAEFCSVCHKVHLPKALNDYKDFLRGQNHYDSFLLSGVSGHGSRSFYYPEIAQQNCNGCHMPAQPSRMSRPANWCQAVPSPFTITCFPRRTRRLRG